MIAVLHKTNRLFISDSMMHRKKIKTDDSGKKYLWFELPITQKHSYISYFTLIVIYIRLYYLSFGKRQDNMKTLTLFFT